MATVSLTGNVEYVGCQPDDTLFDEKLSSIVGYAMSVMGIVAAPNSDITTDAVEQYQRYCNGLQTKIAKYEPFNRSMVLEDLSTTIKDKKALVNCIRLMLPRKTPEFDRAIEQLTENLSEEVARNPALIGFRTSNYRLAEFVVMKVFRSGDNLELIPCLLELCAVRNYDNQCVQ